MEFVCSCVCRGCTCEVRLHIPSLRGVQLNSTNQPYAPALQQTFLSAPSASPFMQQFPSPGAYAPAPTPAPAAVSAPGPPVSWQQFYSAADDVVGAATEDDLCHALTAMLQLGAGRGVGSVGYVDVSPCIHDLHRVTGHLPTPTACM